jgi:hypothetical protein
MNKQEEKTEKQQNKNLIGLKTGSNSRGMVKKL